MLCGIAKDLTKLGGKTVTKLVTPEEQQSSLFKLVSYITGSCMSYRMQVCVLFGYVSCISMCYMLGRVLYQLVSYTTHELL